VIDGYAVMLDAALKYAGTTLLIAVLTLAVTLSLAYRIPKGFFPTADIGLIEATTEAESDISFAAMAARQRALADVITKVPDVTSVSSFVGVDGLNPTINTARMVIALKPHAERTATVTDVMAAVTRAAADVKGLTVRLRAAQELTVDSTRSAYPYALTLRDTDKTVLATWAPLMRDRMMTRPRRAGGAGDRPDGLPGRRPRRRRALRHHAGDHRQRALRCLRPAHHLDHLRRVEPVPRHPRG
jgi:multidrug efflux pump